MDKKKSEIQTYLKERINPIMEPLTVALVKARPENIAAFCIDWFKKFGENSKKHTSEVAECSDEENDTVDDAVFKSKKVSQVAKRNRSAVSAEVYGEFNKKESFVAKVIPKSEDTKTRILILLGNSILFKNLDTKDAEIVMGAMEERCFKAGETIITEGEGGDVLYMVEEGEFDCFKKLNGAETYLKTYTIGDAFGELALMYNAPRAATIKAKTDGKLFLLDRITFNRIVKEAAEKKRHLFETTLKKVELLDSIDPYERSQVCDVLKESTYSPGEYVIRQGDIGDRFYIVVSGKLVAERKAENEETSTVYNYKEGDYFGEIALVRNIPRQASVKALTFTKIVSIERSAFKRVLGPIEDILKRNEERYKKFWSCPVEAN